MTRLIHLRGDVGGMLLYFVLLFLGACQLIVAWKGLNGLSLTGYPDRRALSATLGVALAAGSSAWYFSRPGHFASPDVEGIETLALLLIGIALAVLVQAAVATLLFRGRYRASAAEEGPAEVLGLQTSDYPAPAVFWPSEGTSRTPVLLLGEYGAPVSQLYRLGRRLASAGRPCLAVELDGGHGGARPLIDPAMKDLTAAALAELDRRAGPAPVNAVGVGFGGAVALGLAADGSVLRAVALDPPARDPSGHPATNSARELKPPQLARALLRPAARGRECRVPLSEAVERLPLPCGLPPGTAAIIGTGAAWLNSPSAMRAFASAVGAAPPALLPVRHSEIVHDGAVFEALLESLE